MILLISCFSNQVHNLNDGTDNPSLLCMEYLTFKELKCLMFNLSRLLFDPYDFHHQKVICFTKKLYKHKENNFDLLDFIDG